jgi:beta-glucosidase
MVLRILLEMFTHGLFDLPVVEGAKASGATATTASHLATATRIAEEGSVLLKNTANVLPLTGTGKKLLVVGGAANTGAALASQGFGSGHVPELGSHPNVVTPLKAITARAALNHDTVTYNAGTNAKATAAVAAKSDLAIVFVNDSSVEGVDRPSLNAQSGNCNVLLSKCTYNSVDQNALVSAVAAANPNTIVVVQSGGPIAMPWVNAVKAVVENWLPGQVDGNSIAPLLFGDDNFSGKLPETFPVSLADGPLQTPAQYPGVMVPGDTVGPHVSYSEGLLVGYRWYTSQHIAPLFPFGYGLSYTSFAYSDLHVTPTSTGATVSFTVTNTGTRAGAEIPQLYVTDPAAAGEPPIQLKDYAHVTLPAGGVGHVTFTLDSSAFSIWDTAANGWTVTPGCYGISVGGSSASLPLQGEVAEAGGTC